MKIYYSKNGKNKSIKNITESEGLSNGYLIFYRTALAGDIPYKFTSLVDGSYMFFHAKDQKDTFTMGSEESHDAFPKLKYGTYMFQASGLENIYHDFPSLENGSCMFSDVKGLKNIDYKNDGKWKKEGFDSLKNVYLMFAGSTITSFYRDLPETFGDKHSRSSVKNALDFLYPP